MNKKDIITIIITTLVIAALIAGCIFLTNRNRMPRETQNKADCYCYPNFSNSIFFSENGKIYKYDTENRQLKILVESEIIESYVNYYYNYSVDQVYKGKLFYHYYSDYARVMNFAYYNLLNGENRLINSVKCNLRGEVVIYDGYVYCVYCADNEEGYEVLRISRFNIESGDEQILYESRSRDEFLVAVIDGKIITRQEYDNLFSYNIVNMKKSLLWNAKNNGYDGFFFFSNIGNKLYFLAPTDEYTVTTDPENFFAFSALIPDHYLLYLDINTGEFRRVLDIPISTYCLTENAIYYSPMAVRSVNGKKPYNTPSDEISYTHETLFSCDLDGQNICEVYTNKDTYYSNNYKILNGKVFCQLGLFNHSNQSFDYFDYVEIDLSTKEIDFIDIPE
ncbi:MAG: hypothetical protein IIX44_07180 [Clostridia bacterium]|nr:hypothetical protein [Clostridia bacterium]